MRERHRRSPCKRVPYEHLAADRGNPHRRKHLLRILLIKSTNSPVTVIGVCCFAFPSVVSVVRLWTLPRVPKVPRVKRGEDDGDGQTMNVGFTRGAEKFFKLDTSDPNTNTGQTNNNQANYRMVQDGAPAHSNGSRGPSRTR